MTYKETKTADGKIQYTITGIYDPASARQSASGKMTLLVCGGWQRDEESGKRLNVMVGK